MTEERPIKLKFELTDEYGYNYKQECDLYVAYDLGDREIDRIGECFNRFLSFCGYYMGGKECMFMTAIDPEEYEALEEYLTELRGRANAEC